MSNLGQDVDEAGVEMASDAGGFSVFLPIFSAAAGQVLPELNEVRGSTFCGKVVFVQDCLGPGEVGEEAPDGTTVDAD